MTSSPPRPLTWLPRVGPLKPPPRDPCPTQSGKVSRPFPLVTGAAGGTCPPIPGTQLRPPPGVWVGDTGGVQGVGWQLPQTRHWGSQYRHRAGTDGHAVLAQTDPTGQHRARLPCPAHACVHEARGCLWAFMTPRRSGVGGVPIPCPPPWDGWDAPAPSPNSHCLLDRERRLLSPVPPSLRPAPQHCRVAGTGSGQEHLPWVPRVGVCLSSERGWGCSNKPQRQHRDSARSERGFGTGVGTELRRSLGPKSG